MQLIFTQRMTFPLETAAGLKVDLPVQLVNCGNCKKRIIDLCAGAEAEKFSMLECVSKNYKHHKWDGKV